jgi:hypothetical protein
LFYDGFVVSHVSHVMKCLTIVFVLFLF